MRSARPAGYAELSQIAPNTSMKCNWRYMSCNPMKSFLLDFGKVAEVHLAPYVLPTKTHRWHSVRRKKNSHVDRQDALSCTVQSRLVERSEKHLNRQHVHSFGRVSNGFTILQSNLDLIQIMN